MYFCKHRLAIKIYEKVHNDRNIDYETRKIDWEFIKVNPDEKDFHEYVEIGKIYNHIIESTEK